jgi:tetratricopeptide (TPR) repeat protein
MRLFSESILNTCISLASAIAAPVLFAHASAIVSAKIAAVHESQNASTNPANIPAQAKSAQLLIQNGRFAEAIQLYREILAHQPGNEKIQLALAGAYRRVHNDDEARKTLQAARKQHPRSVAVLSAIGTLEMDAQAYDAAIEALRAASSLAPANPEVRNLLATAYLQKGDGQQALSEFDRVLHQDPSYGLARFMRAGLYSDSGENEKALVDAEKAFAARPDYLPGRILLAKILVRTKDCQRAAEILRPPTSGLKLDGEGLFLLASAYDCAGKRELADQVRTEFEAVSRREHETAENRVQSLHLVEQANELAMQNKFQEAQEILDQALQKNPENAFAYSQQAKIYFSMRQPRQASEAIDRALKFQPYQPDFLFVRGVIDAGERNLDAALKAFQLVTYVNPEEADTYFEIGKIWMQKNDRAQAQAAFRKATELAPDDNDYRQALQSATDAPH